MMVFHPIQEHLNITLMGVSLQLWGSPVALNRGVILRTAEQPFNGRITQRQTGDWQGGAANQTRQQL